MEPTRGDDAERPPPWAGAPGFVPYADDLPPHAPMPGAPPYPPDVEHPPPPVGTLPTRTGFLPVLAAAGAWAVVNLAVVLFVGVTGSATALAPVLAVTGLAVTALVTAGLAWLPARRRDWSLGVLVLVTAPVFWILRAVVATLLG